MLAVVNKVAEAGIVVLLTEVTFGSDVVAVVIPLVTVAALPEILIPAVPEESFVGSSDESEVNKVAEAGIVVLLTEVTFGSDVVVV